MTTALQGRNSLRPYCHLLSTIQIENLNLLPFKDAACCVPTTILMNNFQVWEQLS